LVAEPRRSPDQDLPKRIGRYEAFLQIGAGGMARVYLAVQRGQAGQQQVVVVKVLRREAIEDEHVLALFMDEARIAMRLAHPNVIRTREVIAEPPDYLLAMDFQSGQSLLHVLRRLGRQAVPLDEHIYIITKVLAGLAYAHELKDEQGRPFGIVHRDVSPSNVLVCYTGEIKLLDFGIAKATGALAATQDGVVKGKLGYAAPEQCLGKPADPRSDVYAVGVMLWEAIAGRRRASGETWHSVLQARLDDAEPQLEEVCPDAPTELLAIAHRALGHDPDTRYATAREFQRDLEGYLSVHNVRVGPSRIAAMLKPHFDADRAEQRDAIETHLSLLRGNASGQRRKVPLPGPLPTVDLSVDPLPESEEEDTSRIPVDDALLMKSKRGSMMPPTGDSANASLSLQALSTPPPQNSNMSTAPPPPGAVHTTSSFNPPSGARPSLNAPPSASRPSLNAPPGTPLRGPDAPASGSRQSFTPQVGEQTDGRTSSSGVLRGTLVSAPGTSNVIPASTFGAPDNASTDALARLASDAVLSEPRKKTLTKPLTLGAVGFVALSALGALLSHKGSSENAQTSAGANAEHGAAPVIVGSTTSTPAANEVKVRLAADPPDAELRLDGRLLKGNPFVSVFPKEGTIHELSASADGYREEKQVVQFMQDVDVTISLRHPKAGGRVVLARPAAGAAAAPPARPSEARPSAGGVEPGMDLQTRPDNRNKRNIDEKDPYSQ
jgi:serine/threonine-protein kinase